MEKETYTNFVSEPLTTCCDKCEEEIDPRRVALGYNTCLSCGELLAQEVRFCVVPMHKSNYVVVSRKRDLVGINNKTC
jgi:ribosomal protein L37AE/L43A